jgi:hypothetical protein
LGLATDYAEGTRILTDWSFRVYPLHLCDLW